MLLDLFHVIVFPGALFLVGAALFISWLDRALVARWQARIGPPWYQPLADLLKLFFKEDTTPEGTDGALAALLPIVAVAATLTAGLYVPVGSLAAASFEGDLIIVIFLLSIPTLAYFLAGWAAPSVYGVLGGNRSLLQYFSYDVPFLISMAAPVVYARTWSVQGLVTSQSGHRWHAIMLPVGCLIALIGLIGKLKRVPFDIPHAKSEVGAGPLTEYSGRKLGLWNLSVLLQTLVGLNLLVAVYFGGADAAWGGQGFLVYAIKILALTAVLALIQVLYARLRIDQMASLGWRLLVPFGVLQLLAAVWMGV